MKKISLILLYLPCFYFAQLTTPLGQLQPTTNPETKNIGVGTLTPQSILDIQANESIPIIRGNGGYIPTGLRFIDDSYTQPGQVKEWSIWKGNTFNKGLSFHRYDAVGRCEGGICDIVLHLNDNGNVGIGNPIPRAKLDIGNGAEGVIIDYWGPTSGVSITAAKTPWSRSYGFITQDLQKKVAGFGAIGDGGNINILYIGNNHDDYIVQFDLAKKSTEFISNVSINNKLEAKEIKVTTTPTADFVFEDSYQLPNLESVEKHIKEKKHLPEIASATEMQKEGVNIGDFQIKLLQKIEELTLYSIEQNKLIKQQQQQIERLHNEFNTLKTLKN
ncbi:hypothetical protein HZQ07_17775 [Elizabethkingia anophelis]|uniref:hypothetical protein n=1 Tax=Elizabethkingia anophelis TaxID=1117645 RepID=UPI000C9A532E|nr:hypothetical protein [Elizabethkingia anophelis]MCT3760561.1 hypothetical protein [Elizabethkingia anophelis]MCT3975173.1 hypothetical protein [Elizabethkingia anophelis]